VIEARERATVDSGVPRHIADLELSLPQKTRKVAANHVSPEINLIAQRSKWLDNMQKWLIMIFRRSY
jgi:hypothetical protein